LTALREVILNAVVHRDYTVPSDIQIKIFDDRISIYSPGKLYGDLTIEKLRNNAYQSNLRNKLVAEEFYLSGRIEKYGSGFSRINKELQTYPHIEFCIEGITNGILATFLKHQTLSTDTPVTGEVIRLLQVCNGERSRVELQGLLGLKHEDHFRKAYLLPSLLAGVVEMTLLKTPKSRKQRYRLTPKGGQVLQRLDNIAEMGVVG
jgi:ATP-dependent DNA helicase RecG